MEVCPVCRTDAFLNPRIRFLISPCYHWLCDGCVSRLFSHGSAPCPHCGTTLRQASFSAPSFLDHLVEKECRIRRSLRAALAGRAQREAFGSGEEWELWLEGVEDEVHRLVAMQDVEQAARELDELRRRYRSTDPLVPSAESSAEPVERDAKKRRTAVKVEPPTVVPLEPQTIQLVPLNLTRPLSVMERMMFSMANRHLLSMR